VPRSQFTDSYRLFLDVLIAARKEANLTQAQLALLIGKKQTFISIIETGVRRIDLLEFAALASAMGYAPADLFARVLAVLPHELDVW
jgi:transcriptional regulator with XRE-family HTH domain